ncbi:E3 ubiquitin-protein ligase KCMF1-like [Tropilaelaps mercedesae]|uniref:RING-type E3 ubiquitin transferase n=1 Tax=Tropilaelaps mercedesae TaxID=418985 RepID=A0A1V9XHX1_9ACAR|nr:E3 ubiquitin-protein ligase KCMF1-like [Tropilaelaps mercedesae]
MSRHEGVSCDSCLRNNFKGRRYKCLICFDYDLCGSCFESGAASARHLSSHAMQCMLPRAEYDLYYAGESSSVATDAPLALTCPYCGRMGLTEAALYEHACCEHSDLALEVVCPVCASQPGVEPSNLVIDFVAHIQREHRTGAATAAAGGGGGGDEGHGHHSHGHPHVGAGHGGHHGVPTPSHGTSLQIQQAGVQAQNGTSAQHDLRQQPRRMPSRGGTAGSGGTGLGSRTSRRHPQMTFSSVPLSPRDSAMESITELLSQLSGTRRATSGAGTVAGQSAHSSVPSAQQTIQQLQMQLERQHSAVARQQLTDKLPRRTGGLLDAGGAGGSGLLPPHQAGSLAAGQQDGSHQGSVGGVTGQAQYLLARYIIDSGVGSGGRMVNSSRGASSSSGPAASLTLAGPSSTTMLMPPISVSSANGALAAPDRAQFVENLLLNSLLPNSALWKLHCATTSPSYKKPMSSASSGGAAASGGASSNSTNEKNSSNSNYNQCKQSKSEPNFTAQQTQSDNNNKKRQTSSVGDQVNTTDDSSIADDEDDWGDLAAGTSDNNVAAASGIVSASFSGGLLGSSAGADSSENRDAANTVSHMTSNVQHDSESPSPSGYSGP